MDKGTPLKATTNPASHSMIHFFSKFIHYFLLAFLFILLAGHENINPRLGDSHVDFYFNQSQNLLEISTKAWLINSNSGDETIKKQVNGLTRTFYSRRDYLPAWTLNFNRTEHLDDLIRLVDSAKYFGFPGTRINSKRIKALLKQVENNTFDESTLKRRIDLEIEATQTAFLYMVYLNGGIRKSDTARAFHQFIEQLPVLLESGIRNNTIGESILSVQPKMPFYADIITKLPVYVEALEIIKYSSKGIQKSDLAKVMYCTGNLQKPYFDAENTIKTVVSDFQKNNRMRSSGVLNKSTVSKIKVDLEKKYLSAALNLDRLRKMKFSTSDYLLVNIPEYMLHVYSKDKQKGSFKVVVGKTQTPTPVFSSYLKKIITNPYWTVPRSIANNEMLYRIRTDSTYLERNGYYVINAWEEEIHDTLVNWDLEDPLGRQYWIRQGSRSSNALGKIKFIFPNKQRVFLHDTPSKNLFNRDRRAYSHGCVRVQDPEILAQYLADKYFTSTESRISIKRSIARNKREVFRIKDEVEVHIQYITCSGNDKDRLEFYSDIYGKDKRETQRIFFSKSAI